MQMELFFRREKRTDAPQDFLFVMKLVFPKSNDAPSFFPKLQCTGAIPKPVRFNLLAPEDSICGRLAIVDWASVPKAAIDKDSNLLLRECEVRPAGKRKMSAPAPDAILSEQSGENGFGCLIVSATNCGHSDRPLYFCQKVSHLYWKQVSPRQVPVAGYFDGFCHL